jgi:hypothetical protein
LRRNTSGEVVNQLLIKVANLSRYTMPNRPVRNISFQRLMLINGPTMME